MAIRTENRVQRVQQIEAHCGPATLVMLFSFYGVLLEQKDISKAAGMADIISDAQGMRLDELNMGVQALFPKGDYRLMAKYHSSLDDIATLIEEFRIPVGVEWQGLFPNPDGSSYNQGHYSVITCVDREDDVLEVCDPEPRNLLTRDGTLAIPTFEERWWEVDILPKPGDASVTRVTEMERLIFVITPSCDVDALWDRGFRPATLSLLWRHGTSLERTS